jgi:hypothetical protein
MRSSTACSSKPSSCGFAAAGSVHPRMPSRPVSPNIGPMGTTYAVSWRDSEGSAESGRLEFGSRALRLHGSEVLEITYSDVSEIAVGRGKGDRLGGRTTVVLSRRNGLSIWIAPVAQRAVFLELFDRVSTMVATGARRA